MTGLKAPVHGRSRGTIWSLAANLYGVRPGKVRAVFFLFQAEDGIRDYKVTGVQTCALPISCPVERLSLADWERSFAVNARGHFLVAREAMRILTAQGLGGALVFVATKNVMSPGKDFAAYSASKAAEAQLAKVLALEGAPHGIRSNIVNPDAVFQDSKLWSEEVRRERAAAQGIPVTELEDF